jgi:hypothetical protein
MSVCGAPEDRIPADNYPTPPWVTQRLVEHIKALGITAAAGLGLRILEPCAGEGAIVRELRNAWPTAMIEAWELRDEAGDELRKAQATLRIMGRDALSLPTPWPQRDLVVMNPPFSLAIEFVQRALMSGSRHVFCLGPLSWLCSVGKAGIAMPQPLIIPNRPCFAHTIKGYDLDGEAIYQETIPWNAPTPTHTLGGYELAKLGLVKRFAFTAASEYAWHYWQNDGQGRLAVAGPVTMLPSTPVAERKASLLEALQAMGAG